MNNILEICGKEEMLNSLENMFIKENYIILQSYKSFSDNGFHCPEIIEACGIIEVAILSEKVIDKFFEVLERFKKISNINILIDYESKKVNLENVSQSQAQDLMKFIRDEKIFD